MQGSQLCRCICHPAPGLMYRAASPLLGSGRESAEKRVRSESRNTKRGLPFILLGRTEALWWRNGLACRRTSVQIHRAHEKKTETGWSLEALWPDWTTGQLCRPRRGSVSNRRWEVPEERHQLRSSSDLCTRVQVHTKHTHAHIQTRWKTLAMPL